MQTQLAQEQARSDRELAEARVTDSELEQGRPALLHGGGLPYDGLNEMEAPLAQRAELTFGADGERADGIRVDAAGVEEPAIVRDRHAFRPPAGGHPIARRGQHTGGVDRECQ
jgi:hypothetical protein